MKFTSINNSLKTIFNQFKPEISVLISAIDIYTNIYLHEMAEQLFWQKNI